MDGSCHDGVAFRHTVFHDAVFRGSSPADVRAFRRVFVQVIEIAFLLLLAEDFFPVQVDYAVYFPDVVVNERVQRLVVIHGGGHDDLRLLPEEILQFFPVHQLKELD